MWIERYSKFDGRREIRHRERVGSIGQLGCTLASRDMSTQGAKWFALSPRERDGVRGKVRSKFPFRQFIERIYRKETSRFESMNVPSSWWFSRAWVCPGNNGLRALLSPSPQPSPLGRGSLIFRDGCKSMAQEVQTNGAKCSTFPNDRNGVSGKGMRKHPFTRLIERVSFAASPRWGRGRKDWHFRARQ